MEDWIEFIRDRDFNDFRYHVNMDTLIGLGWKPKHNFEKHLDQTIDWYINNCKD